MPWAALLTIVSAALKLTIREDLLQRPKHGQEANRSQELDGTATRMIYEVELQYEHQKPINWIDPMNL